MKKTLALILSVIMIAAFSALPAFSAEEINDANFNFASVLGFFNAEEHFPDDEITRIQLAEVFYNVVFPTSGGESEYWGESDFPDVPKEKKHIAAAVYGMGVMRGYSDTQFAPDDKVTYNQLVKSMVSFLGYDLYAQNLGGYPSGYLAQATRLQILPGVNVSGNTPVTFSTVAQILKQSIGVEIAIWNHSDHEGTAVLDVLENTDYLEYYRDIKVGRGTVTGNYLTNISGSEITNYFCVFINGELMPVRKTADGIQNKIGYDVRVYYEETSFGKEIIYFEDTGNNNVVEIKAGDIMNISKTGISYYGSGDTANTLSISRSAIAIYNGAYLDSFSVADLNPFADPNLKVDGSIKVIDKNNDSVFETIVVNAFETYIVDSVSDNKIYTYDYPKNGVIDISMYKERNIDVTNIYNEPVDPNTIKKGHIVNVFRERKSPNSVKRIVVSKDTVSGFIEEIEKVGGRISTITIDGMTYEISAGVKVFDIQNRLAAGADVDLYFNSERKVAYIDVDSNFLTGYKLGILVDAGVDNGFDKPIDVLIFDEESKMNSYKFKKTVVVEGRVQNANDFYNNLPRTTAGRIKRELIYFKVDDENQVYSLIFPSGFQNVDGFYKFPESDTGIYTYSNMKKSFNNNILLNNGAIIFSMPVESKRDDYKKYARAESALPTGEESRDFNATLYGTEKEGFVADYVLLESDANVGFDTRAFLEPIFVVESIKTVVDSDGAEKLKLTGAYVDYITYYKGSFLAEEKMFTETIGRIPAEGDIIRVPSFRATGEVTEYEPNQIIDVFDYSENLFGRGENPFSDTLSGTSSYRYGKVIEKSGNGVKVQLYNNTSDTEVFSLAALYYRIIEIKTNAKGEIISVGAGNSESIISEDERPGKASKLVMYSRNYGVAIFVYN